MAPATPPLSFDRLVTAIGQVDAELAAQASRAINVSLTLRNWLIGFHIAEYEQQGADRALYGDKLLDRLSDAAEILTRLSFSHIAELLQCDDPTKRAFYELECIRATGPCAS